MEIKDGELIFERAFDIEALSSFNCGIRELDQLIHKKNNGLRDFVLHNECDTFFVYYNEILVALFVYSNGTFVTDDGNYEATEIDFLAVRKEYRNNNIRHDFCYFFFRHHSIFAIFVDKDTGSEPRLKDVRHWGLTNNGSIVEEKWLAMHNEVMFFIESNHRNLNKHDEEERGKYLNWINH